MKWSGNHEGLCSWHTANLFRWVSNQYLNHKGKQVSTRRQTNTRPKSYERSSVFKILFTPIVLYWCRDFASWFNNLRPNKHLCSVVYVMIYFDITMNKNAALHATPFPFCLRSAFTPFLFCNLWLLFFKRVPQNGLFFSCERYNSVTNTVWCSSIYFSLNSRLPIHFCCCLFSNLLYL